VVVDTQSAVAVRLDPAACPHAGQVDGPVVPHTSGCEECLERGDAWVHLRLCLTCGKVGCCDDSPSRHASAHAREAAHPVIRSAEPGETWCWCFEDEVAFVLQLERA
jgi:CPA2 family monovalent cation:H+ antiporter-2